MIPSLSQETITEYASEAQTIQEPTGADYSQGVRVGKTVPAKWWNWLFRGATCRLGQAKTDAQNMLTELQNVVTDAGITLDGSDNTQLEQAVTADADARVANYVENKRSLFIASWEAGQIYVNDIDTPVTLGPNSGSIMGCFEGGPTGTVIVAKAGSGLDPRHTSDQLMYSFDAVHWYTVNVIVSSDAKVWLLGNYLYIAYGYRVQRADIQVQGRIGTLETLRSISTSSPTYYRTYMVPFPDCIFCFMEDGKLCKFSNASSTFELIDDTGLAQPTGGIRNMILTEVPKLLSDGYYVGNVKVSPDRLTWTPISALTDDTRYNLGSSVIYLANNNVAIWPGSGTYYYHIDANGDGRQISTTDVSADVNRFVYGEDYILAYPSGHTAPSHFSLDGQNYTLFNFNLSHSYRVDIIKVADYYYMTYRSTVYYARTISAELSDYEVLFTLESQCSMGKMGNSPYLFIYSYSAEYVSTPLGNFYVHPVRAIVLADHLVQATPTLIWPDGTTTALIVTNMESSNVASSGNLWITHVMASTGSSLATHIFIHTLKGLNSVIGHTLYLR